ncbi:MAG: hypothetical protein VXW22_02280 [Pseudomonadota bacterium]|nr:hypothetical protein [Pseudomonadota bacterium]
MMRAVIMASAAVALSGVAAAKQADETFIKCQNVKYESDVRYYAFSKNSLFRTYHNGKTNMCDVTNKTSEQVESDWQRELQKRREFAACVDAGRNDCARLPDKVRECSISDGAIIWRGPTTYQGENSHSHFIINRRTGKMSGSTIRLNKSPVFFEYKCAPGTIQGDRKF